MTQQTKKTVSINSSFLFARPSVAEGIARLVDFGGTLSVFNVSDTPEDADMTALFADWVAVGIDLEQGMEECVERDAILAG